MFTACLCMVNVHREKGIPVEMDDRITFVRDNVRAKIYQTQKLMLIFYFPVANNWQSHQADNRSDFVGVGRSITAKYRKLAAVRSMETCTFTIPIFLFKRYLVNSVTN